MTTVATRTPAQHAWLDAVEAEVRELFAPAYRWRRFAPVERTLSALDLIHDIPVTLACWDWQVEVKREKKEWVIVAAKAGPDLDIHATGRADCYSEALCTLAQRLAKAIAAHRKTPQTQRVAA